MDNRTWRYKGVMQEMTVPLKMGGKPPGLPALTPHCGKVTSLLYNDSDQLRVGQKICSGTDSARARGDAWLIVVALTARPGG